MFTNLAIVNGAPPCIDLYIPIYLSLVYRCLQEKYEKAMPGMWSVYRDEHVKRTCGDPTKQTSGTTGRVQSLTVGNVRWKPMQNKLLSLCTR